MLKRDQELLRKLLLRADPQLAEEGVAVPIGIALGKCDLAKNARLTVAGHTR